MDILNTISILSQMQSVNDNSNFAGEAETARIHQSRRYLKIQWDSNREPSLSLTTKNERASIKSINQFMEKILLEPRVNEPSLLFIKGSLEKMKEKLILAKDRYNLLGKFLFWIQGGYRQIAKSEKLIEEYTRKINHQQNEVRPNTEQLVVPEEKANERLNPQNEPSNDETVTQQGKEINSSSLNEEEVKNENESPVKEKSRELPHSQNESGKDNPLTYQEEDLEHISWSEEEVEIENVSTVEEENSIATKEQYEDKRAALATKFKKALSEVVIPSELLKFKETTLENTIGINYFEFLSLSHDFKYDHLSGNDLNSIFFSDEDYQQFIRYTALYETKPIALYRSSSNHATLIYIDNEKNIIEFYDSFFNDRGEIINSLKKLAENLNLINPNKNYQVVVKIPQTLQTNGIDCAVWVSYFLENRLKNPSIKFHKYFTTNGSLDLTKASRTITDFRDQLLKVHSLMPSYRDQFEELQFSRSIHNF